MQLLIFLIVVVVVLVTSEAPAPKRPMVFHNWPPKGAKQTASKQRTLVVQIRSDQPVPLLLKGRPGYGASHAHNHAHAHAHAHAHVHNLPHALALHHVPSSHLRGARPIKLTAPVYLKPGSVLPIMRKPLKIKLSNSKLKPKPAAAYENPFIYEKPSAEFVFDTHAIFGGDKQKLPLETSANFISDHFAPIHTIPAPNLALQDNHIHSEETYLPPAQTEPKPQPYHQLQTQSNKINQNQYQVFEEHTNDQTLIDPNSGAQKLFAPDPDPSLPVSKLRLATESFNQPSNGKPMPIDVQSNHLPPAQPLVQIIGAQQQAAPEIYPIQFTQQTGIQPFITANLATVQAAAPIPLYNPTYLVTQSNNLYSQHQQQLFKPSSNIVEAGYINADLTQELAADGRILQAGKEQVLDSAPQFAALIAAPALGEEQLLKPAPFNLPNVAAVSNGAEGGFVVSNFYGNAQDSSQLLQAYAEEESQRQRLEAEHANIELQQQKHLQQLQQEHDEQQNLLQLQQNHLLQLQQQHLQHQQQQQQQLLQQQHSDPTNTAFQEHARLVQQQLGSTPLRIFVPDEETPIIDLPRLQKRSDDTTKGTVEDANVSHDEHKANDNDMFEVSSSVEVSNENQMEMEEKQSE